LGAAELKRALSLEDFFDEQAGHELRRAVFYELRGDPDYVSALLTTGSGVTTRRVFRALMSVPGSMAYTRRRYRFYEADAERAQTMVKAALDRIVAELEPSGYLVGSGVTVADLTAAALLFPLAWPAELQYDYPGPPESQLIESLEGHPGVAWIREIYRRHRGSSMEIT
jgi:glutathione S-transferase